MRNGSNLDAELTLEQDSRNTMTFALAVESGREDGEDTQRIRLNASGKLAGYSRQIRVSATLRNAAQTDEAGQTVETLRNTLSVGFTDRSPAMQMLSLGDFSLSVKERGEALRHLAELGLVRLDYNIKVWGTADYNVYYRSELYEMFCHLVMEGASQPDFLFNLAVMRKGRASLTKAGVAALALC